MFNKVAIKSIFVLIIIALASGLLLSVLSDVLYVSETEKIAFRISKVYSKSTLKNEGEVDSGFSSLIGSIEGVFHMEDGAVVISSKGFNGYKSGWVKCYTAFTVDGILSNIVIDSNKNQSLISNFTASWLKANFCGKDVNGIDAFVLSGSGEMVYSIVSGATFTSIAIANSVNVALEYLRYIKFLYTEPQEMTEEERRVMEVYPKSAIKTTDAVLGGFESEIGNIEAVFSMKDGAVVVIAKGFNGYRGGWVKCYIAFNSKGVLVNIIIDSNDKQSYIGNITTEWLQANFCNKNVLNIGAFVSSGSGEGVYTVVSGTSRSSNAIANSVNVALEYLRYIEYLPKIS